MKRVRLSRAVKKSVQVNNTPQTMCGITVSIAPRRASSTTTNTNGTTTNGTSTRLKEVRSSLEASLSQSLDKIAHRGPDAQGIWINDDNTVALGHNRLAINDLSESGTQPIHSPDNTVHAVVNGEIYDFERIRAELIRDHDYKFKSTSDSELIVALYQIYGAPDFLSHLRGEFAFVLYDETKNTVIAARDRFGIKPLFWTIAGGRVLFASEAKAFLPLGWEPEWNVGAIVAGDWVTGEKTLFKDVKKIKPGHWMEIKTDGEVFQKKYWDIDYKDKREPETRSVQEMVRGVREKLTEAIRLRLRADVPVGIYLSGGIDSSLVAGIVTKLVREEGIKIGNADASSRICCFTIQFPKESGFDESEIAERTANWLGVKVIKKDMNETTLAENFADAVYHTEHHQIDLNFVGKFVLSTAPRENGFKVVLTGEGSDEHFGGYPIFVGDHLREADLAMANDELAESDEIRLALEVKNNVQLKMVSARAGIFGRRWEDCEAFKKVNGVRVLSWIQNLQPVFNLFAPWVQQTWDGVDGGVEVLKQMSPEALDKIQSKWHPLHTSQYLWSKTVLSDNILTCLGDRGEMAHSVEARPPFLDHELSEYVNGLPPGVKLAYTPNRDKERATGLPWDSPTKPVTDLFTEKWILREAGKPFITQELYERKKHPYVAPYSWSKDGPLHTKFKQICTKEAVENLGFVDWNFVETALVKAFEPGENDGWFRALLLAGAWISLGEKFGIKKASK
ncbi:asparagine synthase [Podospora fimiseda]|uniref:Asparagine synthase n=1 Tax=Podospora fimiseda TaxID=252190 RepID=A0AAN7H0W1_9PEZI|nr:asparagine synthase [Podospora fimiseda]